MPVRTPLVLLVYATSAVTASGVAARENADAETFLRHVYAPYVAGDATVNPTGKAAPTIFDARLTALIRKDQAQSQGEVGALDQDPICDCQDFDRIKLLAIRFLLSNSSRAIADVRFTNLNTTEVIRYTLTRSTRGWRVTDIATNDMPSLVAVLQAGTRRR